MKILCTSDWHIRSTIPICREKEEFLNIQEKTLKQISKIAKDNNAICVIAGDLFDKNKSYNSQELLCFMIDWAKDLYKNTGYYVYIVIGNHEMPYHQKEKLFQSDLGVLLKSDYFKLLTKIPIKIEDLELYGYSYGDKLENV